MVKIFDGLWFLSYYWLYQIIYFLCLIGQQLNITLLFWVIKIYCVDLLFGLVYVGVFFKGGGVFGCVCVCGLLLFLYWLSLLKNHSNSKIISIAQKFFSSNINGRILKYKFSTLNLYNTIANLSNIKTKSPCYQIAFCQCRPIWISSGIEREFWHFRNWSGFCYRYGILMSSAVIFLLWFQKTWLKNYRIASTRVLNHCRVLVQGWDNYLNVF